MDGSDHPQPIDPHPYVRMDDSNDSKTLSNGVTSLHVSLSNPTWISSTMCVARHPSIEWRTSEPESTLLFLPLVITRT